MVWEALLRLIEGLDEEDTLWARGARYETGLATVDQWGEYATSRGFVVTPAPELERLILSRDGGTPYQLSDPQAIPGHDVFHVLVWAEAEGMLRSRGD